MDTLRENNFIVYFFREMDSLCFVRDQIFCGIKMTRKKRLVVVDKKSPTKMKTLKESERRNHVFQFYV